MGDDVFIEQMSLSPKSKVIKRTTREIFSLIGMMGGIVTIFTYIVWFLILPISHFMFRLKVIEKILKLEGLSDILESGIRNKMKLLYNFYPDKKEKRLLDKSFVQLDKLFSVKNIYDKIEKL